MHEASQVNSIARQWYPVFILLTQVAEYSLQEGAHVLLYQAAKCLVQAGCLKISSSLSLPNTYHFELSDHEEVGQAGAVLPHTSLAPFFTEPRPVSPSTPYSRQGLNSYT